MKFWQLSVCVLVAQAVAVAQQAQQAPQVVPCGPHEGMEAICGVKAPEDLERTPDGRYLIASQYASFRTPGEASDLLLLDLKTKTFSKLPVMMEKTAGWGDPACEAPAKLAPHGTSLALAPVGSPHAGTWQLYVVNHAGRQSIEMYELRPTKPEGRVHRELRKAESKLPLPKEGLNWELVWRGCVTSPMDFNDVAILPDGGFVGTHPTGLNQRAAMSRTREGEQPAPRAANADPFAGTTGYVARWNLYGGETELVGTRMAYPNGVNASPNGQTLFINAFGTKEVLRYDMATAKVTGTAKVEFMPDNLTWSENGDLIAAGVKGARGQCGAVQCINAFGIARIDPVKMIARTLFDSGDKMWITGVSVAIEVGAKKPDLYVGAFQGDRIVRIPLAAKP